jgi:type IV pilus assembly protein PilC
MSRFGYKATDRDGNASEGELFADSTRQAIQQLEARGLRVDSISEVDSSRLAWNALTAEEQQAIVAARARTLENVRSWSEPIAAMAQEVESARLAKKLQSVAGKLANASNLEQIASDRQASQLMSLAVQDIHSKDSAIDWLSDLTIELESRRVFWRAVWYPVLLTLLSTVILFFLAIVVIPIFKEMYREFGLRLPPVTTLVIAISDAIYPNYVNTFVTVGLTVSAFIVLIVSLKRSRLLLKYFPSVFTGSSSGLRALGTITCNAAELVANRYPVYAALRQAARGCDHHFYRRVFLDVADELESGKPPLDSSQRQFIPPLLMSQLACGFEDRLLSRRIGKVYIERGRHSSQKVLMIFSHFTILALGLATGFVVIALFSPLLKLVSLLT